MSGKGLAATGECPATIPPAWRRRRVEPKPRARRPRAAGRHSSKASSSRIRAAFSRRVGWPAHHWPLHIDTADQGPPHRRATSPASGGGWLDAPSLSSSSSPKLRTLGRSHIRFSVLRASARTQEEANYSTDLSVLLSYHFGEEDRRQSGAPLSGTPCSACLCWSGKFVTAIRYELDEV